MVDIKRNTLLIGNGLNRCLNDNISWENLLSTIAKEYGIETNLDIPLPLEFERVVNCILMRQKNAGPEIYKEIKTVFAKQIANIGHSNMIFKDSLSNLDIQGIITTNYDFLLEKIYQKDFRGCKGIPANQKYLLKPITNCKGIEFFHPHGCADRPNTMCLGYEHYMGIVENARNNINSKPKNSNSMRIKRKLFDEENFENIWMERFYTDNIGIIGLGLHESEFDLWWVLTHRASLFYTNYQGINELLNNRIVYYATKNLNVDSKENEQYERRKLLLESMNVIVREYIVEDCGGYQGTYNKILDDIRRDGIR